MVIRVLRRGFHPLAILAAIGMLAGCAVAPPRAERQFSTVEHYEMACNDASDDIDILMVHWENPRSHERMPEFQMTQARQAMRVIAPVCDNLDAVGTLDNVQRARVQAAFRTLEQVSRNLPRMPAGA